VDTAALGNGLGILVGPQALGWAAAGPTIQVLANFGLAFLFFLTGFEIDFPAIRGQPIVLAALGWLASFVVAATKTYDSGTETLFSQSGPKVQAPLALAAGSHVRDARALRAAV
jgi:Kef-type K+ transport system membrane component KefB